MVAVTLNYAMSLDGKISTPARGRFRFTSDEDRRLMDALRAAHDAVLIGAGTLRAEDPPLQVRDPALRDARRRAGLDPALINVVLSASLNLPFGGRFFTTPGARRIVATVEDAREDLVRRIGSQAEVLRLGRGRVDVDRLLAELERRGVTRLLVEGGGEVNAAFLEADRVDEIRATVAPLVIGGRSAPTPVDGEGFLAETARPFTLVEVRQHGQEIFLHYRRSR